MERLVGKRKCICIYRHTKWITLLKQRAWTWIQSDTVYNMEEGAEGCFNPVLNVDLYRAVSQIRI